MQGKGSLPEPYCWVCGRDAGGRQVVTIREAAEYCGVSINCIYRWMDQGRIEWVYTAGGKRRIYKDSLIRRPKQQPPAGSKTEPGVYTQSSLDLRQQAVDSLESALNGALTEPVH